MARKDYEDRLEARRDRLEARAASATREAEAGFTRAREMASVIPFGQPILIGHHSEQRDRNYRNRIHATQGRALEASEKARHYAAKAASVGQGGISSDNPEAINLLRGKLAQREKAHEQMKQANAIIRKHKADPAAAVAALAAAGWGESRAVQLLKPDFAGRVGFPDYALKNNNAEIRRIKQRIAQLEQEAERAAELAADPAAGTLAGDGFTITEDTDENRMLCRFDARPAREVCQHLRRHGWRWAPSLGAWSRLLNNASRYEAQRLAAALPALLEVAR